MNETQISQDVIARINSRLDELFHRDNPETIDLIDRILDKLEQIENIANSRVFERPEEDPFDDVLINNGHRLRKRGRGDRKTAVFVVYDQYEHGGRKIWNKTYCDTRDEVKSWLSSLDCGGMYHNVRVFRTNGIDVTMEFCKEMSVEDITDIRRKK